jgi:steroid delta-isomerase-like uncharacterized protein
MDKLQVMKRYYDEIWNKGDASVIDELMAPQYENHDPSTPGTTIRGRDAFKGLLQSYKQSFPDLTFVVKEQHVADDVVITRWTAQGTHKAALMGVPATGIKGEPVTGITITRFEGDRIVDDYAVWDTLGLLRSLGAIPA